MAQPATAVQERPWTVERVQQELPEVLHIEDVAAVLRIGKKRCYEQIRNGEFPLPHDRWGRAYVVLKKDLIALLTGDQK